MENKQFARLYAFKFLYFKDLTELSLIKADKLNSI